MDKSEKILQIFVISWCGQHENAMKIADSFKPSSVLVTIIFSDPNPAFSFNFKYHAIKRPNHLFWGDKFKACLDECKSSSMLIIHADCFYHNWLELYEKCFLVITKYPNIGAWAPEVNNTFYDLKKTSIAAINKTTLDIVAHTSGTIFCLTKKVIDRMRRAEYEENVYGWGIGWMFISYLYSHDMIAVVDRSIKVEHSKLSGYNHSDADYYRRLFLNQLSISEFTQYLTLNSFIMRSTQQKN